MVKLMRSLLPLLLLTASCGGQEPIAPTPVLPVSGSAIDGSEDVLALESVPVPEPEINTAAAPLEESARAVVLAASVPESEPEPEPEPEPEGPLVITYRDLTLIDYDVDAMLDAMLFPEEYEEEEDDELDFPPELMALDGKEVSIVGYMIPGEIEQGNVRDFMLVRDLLGCCFGGTPMPDEWIDVTMEVDAEAEYRPYLPMRVTGVLTLGGEQDEAGFALGVYRLKGSAVKVED
ncbi:MAG: hypothetical protein ACI9F9_002428 [Candidatus Paceibacteria bacterium]|jgi:hypothetical protein